MPGRRNRPVTRGGTTTGRSGRLRRLAGLALTALLIPVYSACAVDPLPGSATAGPRVEHIGTYVWRVDDKTFGGFSGLELSSDGSGFTALSDRATIRWGSITRDAQGRIESLQVSGQEWLKDAKGKRFQSGWTGDSEGLAIDKNGTIWISFEGLARIIRYDTPESAAQPLPRPRAFDRLQKNSSFEALAITADGTLLTLPERSGELTRPFLVWRWRNGKWDQPFSIARNGDWLPVGADIGPDGRYYLLERDFKGLLGFRSRVRRFDLTEKGFENGTVLLESRPLQYDNLEGISVWDDGQDIRLTMISDDNFHFLQSTELVEYRVTD